MNGWDLFTWFNCAILAGAAITIFGLFLKDAKGIFTGHRSDADARVPTTAGRMREANARNGPLSTMASRIRPAVRASVEFACVVARPHEWGQAPSCALAFGQSFRVVA